MVPGVDLRSLPLRPVEGFVLSRVDGLATLEELADLTSLSPDVVESIVTRLAELGVIRFFDDKPAPPDRSAFDSEPTREVAIPNSPGTYSRSAKATPADRVAFAKPADTNARRVPTPSPFARSSDPRTPAPPAMSAPGERKLTPPAFSASPSSELKLTPSGERSLTPPPSGARRLTPSPMAGVGSSSPPDGRAAVVPNAPVFATPEPPSRLRTPEPPLYDPAELAEDVELAPDRRKRILDVYYRLEKLSHYELLGVAGTADRKQVRAAYFELSKVFHPDTAFRKRLGSYKAKMEAVFNRLTEAYEVLGKTQPRAEYDAYLAARAQTLAAAEELLRAERAAAEVERRTSDMFANVRVTPFPDHERPQSSGAASAPFSDRPSNPELEGVPFPSREPPAPNVFNRPTAPAEPPTGLHVGLSSAPDAGSRPTLDPEARRRTQELYTRKLAAATGRPPTITQSPLPGGFAEPPPTSTFPNVPTSTQPTVPPDMKARVRDAFADPPTTKLQVPIGPHSISPDQRHSLLTGLAQSLKQVAAVTGGGTDRATRHVAEAKKAEQEGNLVAAANSMRLALAVGGESPELRADYTRVRTQLATSLAENYERQAQYEERSGKLAAAAASWIKVCEGRPTDVLAHTHAARLLASARGDLHEAKRMALRATELGPTVTIARRVLGEVYLAAGLLRNAKREFQTAAKLDPADEIVKNHLKDLRDVAD